MKNLKNFGITFAASFVILGIIALFACKYVGDTVCGIFDGGSDKDKYNVAAETTASEKENAERLARDVEGDSFTWLMVVSDYRPSVFDDYYPTSPSEASSLGDFKTLGEDYRLPEATSIVLVRAYVPTREYVICTIPSMTQINTSAGEFTLGEYYAVAGIKELVNKVSALTGLSVDYYSVIHSTDLAQLAGTVGSIECVIPVDIYTDGKNYVSAPKPEETTAKSAVAAKETTSKTKETTSVKEEKETVKLTNVLDKAESVKLAKYLSAALLYLDEEDGIDTEMTILQSASKGLLKNLSEMSDSELTDVLSSVDNYLVASDISSDTVLLTGDIIRGYEWFEIHTLTYPGKFVPGKGDTDSYYKADLEKGTSYFYDYRD